MPYLRIRVRKFRTYSVVLNGSRREIMDLGRQRKDMRFVRRDRDWDLSEATWESRDPEGTWVTWLSHVTHNCENRQLRSGKTVCNQIDLEAYWLVEQPVSPRISSSHPALEERDVEAFTRADDHRWDHWY